MRIEGNKPSNNSKIKNINEYEYAYVDLSLIEKD